eukprot:PRCOL_00005003-RA
MAPDAKPMTQSTTLGGNLGGSIAKENVAAAVDDYVKFHDTDGGDVEKRKSMYADMVNKYYDLSTSFYEYGWGESFHFAHRRENETLRESIRRHEHYLALKLGLDKGMKVLDVGCGVGGPAREIATFSGCHVTGLNNNAYQVTRANAITAQRGLSDQLEFVKGDFMNLPFEEGSFDAAYQIEATVHAPDPVGCYRNIFKALKPGGFVVEYAEDLAPLAEVAWWEPLSPSSLKMLIQNPSSFKSTKLGGTITRYLVMGLEAVGLAPKGSVKVSQFLEKGADGLILGGKQGTFTPMFCYVARKPAA